MAEVPFYLKDYEPQDPEFIQLACMVREKAQVAGALDAKTKRLINLALAAVRDQREVVASHARLARELGATDDELIEVIRLVFLNAGMSGLTAGTAAFGEQS